MNIPIKFRGKRIDNGEFVYGYLIQHFINSRVAKAIIYWNLVMHEVEPETVAQLVGYDKDENEVYKGDILTDDRGNIWFAKTRAYAIYESHCEDITRELNEVRLKENKS